MLKLLSEIILMDWWMSGAGFLGVRLGAYSEGVGWLLSKIICVDVEGGCRGGWRLAAGLNLGWGGEGVGRKTKF